MKAIFLDIDGVLVNDFSKTKSSEYIGYTFHDLSCERLQEIIDKTGAQIVVSSSWRIRKDIRHVLKCNGLKMFSKTKELRDCIRGEEIKLWLNTHWGIESFVILDDDDDMGDLLPHLVKTSWWTGITDEHMNMAISILNS